MRLDSIDWGEDTPRVKLRPSDPDGIFILDSRQQLQIGTRVVMYDVRVPDALAVEAGDVSSLRKYILPQRHLEKGTYRMIGSCMLVSGEHTENDGQWFVGQNIIESPAVYKRS